MDVSPVLFLALALLAFGSLFLFSLYWVEKRRLRLSRIEVVDRMSGKEFESYLAELFQHTGYQVRTLGRSADFGADLIITKDGKRTVVQAKRYEKPVGVKAIQEAATARYHYKCNYSMVVTNRSFTKQARELAWSSYVRLMDRSKLIKLALEARKK